MPSNSGVTDPQTAAMVAQAGQVGISAAKANPSVGPGTTLAPAPNISSPGAAMQTAMARSAGISAPAQYNATQQSTISGPFDRANAELAAINAGNSGVAGAARGSVNPAVQDNALALQQEITRRAVQQTVAQHEVDSGNLELQKQKLAYDKAAMVNGHTTDQQKQALDLYKSYTDLGLTPPKSVTDLLGAAGQQQRAIAPASLDQVAKDAGISPKDVPAVLNNALFSATGAGIVSAQSLAAQAMKGQVSFPEFQGLLQANLPQGDPNRQAVISAAEAMYGPMMRGYVSPVAADAAAAGPVAADAAAAGPAAAPAAAPATPAAPAVNAPVPGMPSFGNVVTLPGVNQPPALPSYPQPAPGAFNMPPQQPIASPEKTAADQLAAWNAASPALKTLARAHGGMYVNPQNGQLIVVPKGASEAQASAWDKASPALKTLVRAHGGMYVDPATGQLIVQPK